MQFVIYCSDSENGDALRAENMDAHHAHLGTVQDKIMLGGPCPADDGDARQASMLVVEAEDAAAARAIAESDPFFKAGVWDSVMVRHFKALTGKWAPPSD